MTKQELLKNIKYAIDNNCFLALSAGDYFADYIKIVKPYTMNNFEIEIEEYGTDKSDGPEDVPCVRVDSVDVKECGCMTGDRNQYFIYNCQPIPEEEVKDILWFLEE